MKIALVSLNDPSDLHQWSGLNYFISSALERAGASLHRIGPLDARWTTRMRLRQRWYDLTDRDYHAVMEPSALAAMGAQARAQIPRDADVVVAITSLVAAAIGPLHIPHVSWDDATHAAMLNYYPDFHRLPAITRRHLEALGARAAGAVSLAIYTSEWAARSAREAYGLPAERTAVVPFGANLLELPDPATIRAAIPARSTAVCHLLWVGVEWERKGGALTLDIARAIHAAGVPVTLTLVGCEPPDVAALPSWVTVEGFISKLDPGGEARLAALFSRATFFVMPSRAEAFGLVYVEAATFGVPVVAIRTGGVPSIIVDDETGLLADPGTPAVRYAERMIALVRDRARYDAMAFAALARATSELNWSTAGKRVLQLIGKLTHSG